MPHCSTPPAVKLLPSLLAAALLAASLLSCNKRTSNNDAEGCPKGVACTMEARSVGLRIRDKSGQPVVLDDFKTVRNRDGRTVSQYQPSSWTDTMRRRGSYMVLGDGTGQTERNGLAFTFIGYKAGTELVRERFIIGHDCCHVELLEGPQEITVSE